jgi:hypothetical protein|tara:strand:- start:109 stop:282 length:174 start_codon:yes stop_codon:yes gene_type:complete
MDIKPDDLAKLIRKDYRVSWALAKAIAVAEFAMNHRDLLLQKEKNNIIEGKYDEVSR